MPNTLKTENKNQENLMVGYVCIEESFDTISIWIIGGVVGPPPMDYGSGKSTMDERVKEYFQATVLML